MTTHSTASAPVAAGVVVAVVAGLHKLILTSTPVNDDFMHLAYSRQLLHGDLPLRDFWDLTTTLMYALSAASQLMFGHRLLAEALIVGGAAAVSAFLIFRVVQRTTGSTVVATVMAALFVVAGPRVYAYPKWIVYAVATYLWWAYVWAPSARKAVGLGIWTAVAFYWRHDHGLWVAIGVALAIVTVHGFDRTALRRVGTSAAAAFVLVLPYLTFAVFQLDAKSFARTELATLRGEHTSTHAALYWPLRAPADWLRREPAESYAPEMTVRWKPGTPSEDRAAILMTHGLTAVADDGPQAQRVRLSAQTFESLRAFIDDPLVEDTADVERGAATFSWSEWPVWKRLPFRFSWLRWRLLAGVDQPLAAGAAAAIMLVGIPVAAALLASPWLRRFLPPAVSPGQLLRFALFAELVNLGLLREPYESRTADVIVLPAVLLGVLLVVLWRRAWRPLMRWPLRALTVVLLIVTVKSLAVAGEFDDRLWWLLGDGRSIARAAGAWREVATRLTVSPPSRFWEGRGGPVTVRFAEYARRCLLPSDRTLVMWFAPEIYYNADRLMAGRHAYFFTAFHDVEGEQRRELAKVVRSNPKIVFANRSNYRATAAAFPAVVEFLELNYSTAAAFEEDGEHYSILISRHTAPLRDDPGTGWPCFTTRTPPTEPLRIADR
jgi:hypothetical protein